MNTKTPEEILKPYIETPFRHTRIVDADNAIKAINEYAEQFNSKPINIGSSEDILAKHTREHFAMTSNIHAAKKDILKAMEEYASQFADASRREISEEEICDKFVNRLFIELDKKGYDTGVIDGDTSPEDIIANWFHGKISDLKAELDNSEKAHDITLNQLVSQPQKEGWIPVTERLPEEGSDVIVIRFVRGKYWIPEHVIYSEQIYKGWREEADYIDSTKYVTHWQPLPNPPITKPNN